MTKRFRAKPVIVEAIQWTGDNLEECLDFIKPVGRITGIGAKPNSHLFFSTDGGEVFAKQGDWIIKGFKDRIHACEPGIFEEIYEEVTE